MLLPGLILDTKALRIKYDGQTNLIEANTFISTLSEFVFLVKEVNKELEDSSEVEIKINSGPKPGSFILDLIISCNGSIENLKPLFNSNTISYAANLVTVVAGIYGLAGFLKGKKPKSSEQIDSSVKIENEFGTVNYVDNRVYNIYTNNRNVQNSLNQTFGTLNEDNSVTGFELHEGTKIMAKITKEDFKSIAKAETEQETIDEQTEIKNAVLNIVSLDWDLKKKWDFYYLGNKISAKIKDEAFADVINKGKRFGKGDSLEVELQIKKEYDNSVDTFINKSYTVTKILKHLPRADQTTLELN